MRCVCVCRQAQTLLLLLCFICLEILYSAWIFSLQLNCLKAKGTEQKKLNQHYFLCTKAECVLIGKQRDTQREKRVALKLWSKKSRNISFIKHFCCFQYKRRNIAFQRFNDLDHMRRMKMKFIRKNQKEVCANCVIFI